MQPMLIHAGGDHEAGTTLEGNHYGGDREGPAAVTDREKRGWDGASMSFRTIPDDGEPLRLVLVGVGAMGQSWLAVILDCPEVELVGLVDLNREAALAVAKGLGLDLVVGTDVVEVARTSGGQAV